MSDQKDIVIVGEEREALVLADNETKILASLARRTEIRIETARQQHAAAQTAATKAQQRLQALVRDLQAVRQLQGVDPVTIKREADRWLSSGV